MYCLIHTDRPTAPAVHSPPADSEIHTKDNKAARTRNRTKNQLPHPLPGGTSLLILIAQHFSPTFCARREWHAQPRVWE